MRIRGLDFLRGIAILGVMCRHSYMDGVLVSAGGYGVDLFFVLSGFLVAGLLFSEYQKTGNAGIRRFLIRRGFKIYPAFYIYLCISILIDFFLFKKNIDTHALTHEVFFLQSYLYPFRIHTWSLAVEEHFYFLLSLLIFLSVKFGWLENKKAVIAFLISLIALVFTLRLIFCIPHIGKPVAFFATHLRIDGLFTGALISYIWYFKPNVLEKFYRHRFFFFILGVGLVAPAFLLSPGSFFMMTIGFNLLHLGFAVFILLFSDKNHESFLFRNKYLKRLSLIVCFIGVNSYSIYLWHLIDKDLVDTVIAGTVLNTLVFFTTAIALGTLSSYLVERTFLKIRNHYFPSIAKDSTGRAYIHHGA